MSSSQLLEQCSKQLAAIMKTLQRPSESDSTQKPPTEISQTGIAANCAANSAPASGDDPAETHRLRQSLLAQVSQLETLLCLQEPDAFLRRLNRSTQLLACIGWLAEFQVLAFIPMQGSVATSDLSELVGVPEAHLLLVVQMMATVRFLHLPHFGQVAHTPLSAAFVKKPSLLDAALFAADIGAPAAFHITDATRNSGAGDRGTAYNFASRSTAPFSMECKQRQRLQRQCLAYLRYFIGEGEASLSDALMQYDWQSLTDATVVVVEAGACPMAAMTALANLHPTLQIIVQLCEIGEARKGPMASIVGTQTTHSRVSVDYRPPGSPQAVLTGSIYVLSFPAVSPLLSSSELYYRVAAELRSHLTILASSQASILLVMRGVDWQGEADAFSNEDERSEMAFMRELTLWQLTDDRQVKLHKLMELIQQVQDGSGSLTVVNRPSVQRGGAVAIEVRYQAYNKQAPAWPAF